MTDFQVKTTEKSPISNVKKRKLNEISDPVDTPCSEVTVICNTNGGVKESKPESQKTILERRREKSKLRSQQNGKLRLDSPKVTKPPALAPDSTPVNESTPSLTLKDFAGHPTVVNVCVMFAMFIVLQIYVVQITPILQDVVRLMMHFYHPEIYNHMKLDPPRGFLLHGPPGCGKTLLAQAVAGVSTNVNSFV